MSTRDELILYGYREILAASVEGIPYIFAEDLPKRHDNATDSLALPSNYVQADPCLFFRSGDKLEVEVDRSTGFSRGAAVDLLLSWDEMEGGGLTTSLFTLDRNQTEITSSLAYNTTTIPVSSASGFTDPGGSGLARLYLGRELVTYTDVSGSNFTGCTRAVLSEAYAYVLASPSYRKIADKPNVWRGRQVTIHAHLVSPMGVALDDTWLTGTYHRVLWRGYIDAPPRPTPEGMVLRCLPLCRLPSQEIGHEIKAALYAYSDNAQAAAGLPVYTTPAQVVRLRYTTGTTVHTVDLQASTSTVENFGSWAHFVDVRVIAALGSVTGFIQCDHEMKVIDGRTNLVVKILMQGATFVTGGEYWIDVGDDGPYFLDPGTYIAKATGYQVGTLTFSIPVRYHPVAGCWLAVLQTEGEAWNDLTIPARGIGLVENDGGTEVIAWDAKVTSADALYQGDTDGVTMLRISARAMNGSADTDLAAGGDLAIMSGAAGDIQTVLQKMLSSSGTGQRDGTYDVLSMAMGYGVNGALIDADSLADPKLKQDVIEAVSDGRSSLEDLVGGWMVLNRRALTQVLADDDCKLAVVKVTIPSAISKHLKTIAASGVLLTGVEAPEVLDGSNEIRVDLSGIQEGATVITQDLPRIQAEGPRSMELTAPGMDAEKASFLSATLIAQSDGATVISLTLAPWMVHVQPGDGLILTLAHPSIYDFVTGTRGGASVLGRCLGWSYDIETGHQQITALLAGNVAPPRMLCPSAFTTSTENGSATTLNITSHHAGIFFYPGHKVHVYNPGTSDLVELTIDSVGATSLTFTGTVTFATSVALQTVITYCDEADATAEQEDYAYTHASTTWE
jgi:hypothetical protein